MTIYARIDNGIVAELFTPPEGVEISECFVAPIAAQFVALPEGSPAEPGWTFDGTIYAVAVVPPPTLAQQAAALLAAGLAIVSTGTPALSATYPVDQAARQKVMAVQTVLSVIGTFPNGDATWPIKDLAGNWHICTPGQFTAIAVAMATFAAPCDLIIDGHTDVALPAANAIIP